MKWRVLLLSGVVLLTALAMAVFFYQTQHQSITLEQLNSFEEAVPNSKRVIINQADCRTIRTTLRTAKRLPGIIDVSAPNYRVTGGRKSYYVWLRDNGEIGSMMKTSNTHYLYQFRSPEKLLAIYQMGN
ncbi:hypothetical protein [Sporosarcina sp. A2]|uniref:hypothetical protein n=1 Tax=Sporosarcina sp. A2 TaxID=3393449 RepID=UPI003D796ACF